mmetsp:Transcript_38305/g.101024  ORF Transcript_38305/g.101024 Transcript_38305/m.101024 type:complete len:203 (-) Transcript_38305:154-762(-)
MSAFLSFSGDKRLSALRLHGCVLEHLTIALRLYSLFGVVTMSARGAHLPRRTAPTHARSGGSRCSTTSSNMITSALAVMRRSSDARGALSRATRGGSSPPSCCHLPISSPWVTSSLRLLRCSRAESKSTPTRVARELAQRGDPCSVRSCRSSVPSPQPMSHTRVAPSSPSSAATLLTRSCQRGGPLPSPKPPASSYSLSSLG